MIEGELDYTRKSLIDLPLAESIHSLLMEAGSPVPFETLMQALAKRRGIVDLQVRSLESLSEESPLFSLADPSDPIADALDRLEWESDGDSLLGEIWRQVRRLRSEQAAALILGLKGSAGKSGVQTIFIDRKIASPHEIAETLRMSVERFTALRTQLPMRDREIANLLNEHSERTLGEQQISNLRSVALRTLRRRLKRDAAGKSNRSDLYESTPF
jgi:hypothetical protein